MDEVAKIVGVSDDLDAVARCEKAVREAFGPQVGTQQSTPAAAIAGDHPDRQRRALAAVLSGRDPSRRQQGRRGD